MRSEAHIHAVNYKLHNNAERGAAPDITQNPDRIRHKFNPELQAEQRVDTVYMAY